MEELWRENNIFYNILCFVITENEKLFDRSDANLYWRTVFHTFWICHYAFVGVFATSMNLLGHHNPNIQSLHTYRTAYLTGWNIVFQTIFLGLSLGHDILEWSDKQNSHLASRIRYWRDVIFNGMVVPFTLFVTTMFWSVYAIDRELVFPKIYDEVVPWWFNHCVHTNITIMIIIETLLQARRRPTNEKLETILYCAVALAYAVVYYTIYYFTRRWLYQVFGVMNWWQVCLYQLLIWFGSYAFYKFHFPVNRLIHGSEDDSEEVNVNKVKEVKPELRDVEHNNGVADKNGVWDRNAVADKNGVVDRSLAANENGIADRNGVADKNEVTDIDRVVDKNGVLNSDLEMGKEKNGLDSNEVNGKVITDLKTPPPPTKSWSLKYRSMRSQFENSHL